MAARKKKPTAASVEKQRRANARKAKKYASSKAAQRHTVKNKHPKLVPQRSVSRDSPFGNPRHGYGMMSPTERGTLHATVGAAGIGKSRIDPAYARSSPSEKPKKKPAKKKVRKKAKR